MAIRSMRIEYGNFVTEIGKQLKNIVVLEGDLKESTQSVQFQNKFPNRYFEIGVAEQNMVGIAAGLSLEGKIPIVHSFATFISMRACEQVRTTVAYPNLNVKFVVTHAGISAGSAGPTHHAIEDIAIMRSIPNMTVLVPGDVSEMKQVVVAALEYDGPVYIRLPAGETEDIYQDNDSFSIGKATILRNGKDLTIITTGVMVREAVVAADNLKNDHGINTRVLQMASVKPIDANAIMEAAEETGLIVTVEEHNVFGGLGGAVCETVAKKGNAKVKIIGINDHYCGIGTASYLMKQEGLTIKRIVNDGLSLVNE